VVFKAAVFVSLVALAASALAIGCTTSNCQPIPDGVYAAIGPDGGALTAPATGDAGADAGDAAAVETPVTYTFHGGLPVPYDTWTCDRPTPSCSMSYACTQGYTTVGIVTSFSPGIFAFSITRPPGTTPGTIIHLRAP
jgi:hypothetical protein